MSNGIFPVHPQCEIGRKLTCAISDIEYTIKCLADSMELGPNFEDAVKQASADGQTLGELKMALLLLKDKVEMAMNDLPKEN